MKNHILILLAVLPLLLKAQYNEWIPGKPLTDSWHNNRNACLFGQYTENILFWDQELDSTSTQLCFRNIYASGIGEEHILRSEAGVKLTNPKILDLSPYTQPPNYLVLFQTNEGKDIDLKWMMYQTDGTFSQPVTVSELQGDDVNLAIDEYGIAAWQNNGKIWVSQYLSASNSFTTPFAIDSVGTYEPVFSANSLHYLKQNGDSTTLKSLSLFYNMGNWNISNLKIKSIRGECSCLASLGNFFGVSVCMQNKIGSNPSGLILFDEWNNQMEYLNSSNFNYTQPTVSDFIMYTKSAGSQFLAFVSDSLSQREIFAKSPFNELQNISQWPGEDRNPKMFFTFPYSFIGSINLLWESDREGFSTIYHTHFDYFLGAIAEKPKAETLLVKPCPFNDQTTIQFQATGKTNVRILDLQGKEVKKLLPQMAADGWQNAVWDGKNCYGNSVPSGSYVILVSSENKTESRIIIKK